MFIVYRSSLEYFTAIETSPVSVFHYDRNVTIVDEEPSADDMSLSCSSHAAARSPPKEDPVLMTCLYRVVHAATRSHPKENPVLMTCLYRVVHAATRSHPKENPVLMTCLYRVVHAATRSHPKKTPHVVTYYDLSDLGPSWGCKYVNILRYHD